MSSFATNPKRDELIKEISNIIDSPLKELKKQAHLIHDIQTKWQLLDLSSRPASRDQWTKFNELTNKAWEPCGEYFDELKDIKINNAKERIKIIHEIDRYVENNSKKWPDAKTLIFYLRDTFDKWQQFAPVLDKDLNKLKKLYFEAKKPINDQIKKQEQLVVSAKESLIAKVDAISNEDNDICIKQFNDLKNEWKKAGSAGRKLDNKLWETFNKSADRFFNVKKEIIDGELEKAQEILTNLKSDEISINDASNNLNELKNINKSKEYESIKKLIKVKKSELQIKQKETKINSYVSLLESFVKNDLHNNDLPSSIKNKLNKEPLEKSNTEKLRYSCVKLESLANLDSLKKDIDLRQSIQMEMLTNKFNKTSNDLNSLDELLIHFINNISSDPSTAEKALWKRISKSIEILV